MLCERLEHAHSAGKCSSSSIVTGVGVGSGVGGGGSGTVSGVGELLKHSFGGKICNQMLKDIPSGVGVGNGSAGASGSGGSADDFAMMVDDVVGDRAIGSDNSAAMEVGAEVEVQMGVGLGVDGGRSVASDTPVNSINLDVREQEDPFVCLSLQVKDARGLEDSLMKFVQGEQISDFKWDDHGPRVNIIKRQCLSQLSGM